MLISEELQGRADQLKVGHWVNCTPRVIGDECLMMARGSHIGEQRLSEPAARFLEWWVYGKVSHSFGKLTRWNDSYCSVGPIITKLKAAAICAKELHI